MLGDADQLRQVLANLLRNALVHTPAGTPIEVAVRRDGGARRARGARPRARACPTDDADALFERFWRAEAGRERGARAAPGSGWRSSPASSPHTAAGPGGQRAGGGAAFVVRLPLAALGESASLTTRVLWFSGLSNWGGRFVVPQSGGVEPKVSWSP